MTTLRNARFSAGWYHPSGIPELQIPDEWLFTDYSGTCNPIDPAPHSAFVRPEVRVLTPDYLPPDEWPVFVSPENTQVVKAFKGYGAWYSALSQNFALASGNYDAIIEVFPDLVDHYENGQKVWAADPLSARVRVMVDGQAVTDWTNLLAGSRVTVRLPFTTSGGGNIAFEFMLPFPLNNSGLFLSRLDVEATEPEPPECYGLPREDYVRRYNVYPTDATEARRIEIATECARVQQTCGPSYDDAGIGDLADKTAVLWDIPADIRADFLDFYLQYYPGTIVEFAGNSPEPRPDVIPYSQRDPEWSYLRLLPSTATMGASGCLVTALAIYATLVDETVTPGTLCLCLREHNGFNNNGGLIFAAVAECLPYMQFRDYKLWNETADMAVVSDALSRGPTILKVDWDVSDPDIDSHFVWAYDWTDETHTDIEIIDPWTGEYTTILTAYPRGMMAQSVKGIVDFEIVDPEPPEPPVQPIRPPGTNGAITLHWMPTGVSGVQNFLQTIHPPAIKLVASCEHLGLVRAWSPSTLIAYRRVEDDLDVYNPSQAAGFVQRYIADLSAQTNLNDFSQPPVYLVSINEKYECRHTTQNAAAAAWDIAFISAIEATGLNLKAMVYTAPVGNPEPDAQDLAPLLPMVQRVCAGRHLLGKHCYYASVPSQPQFYQQSWNWYGGRFALDDAYFVSQGLYPFWLSGEAGACMATPNPNGSVSLSSGDGWKSCGDIERYRDELIWANQWYMDWNATHGGRLLGVALFTTHGWGWDKFRLEGGDLDVVTAGLAGEL